MTRVLLRFQTLASDYLIATAELREIYDGPDWSPPNHSACLAFDGRTEVAFGGFGLTHAFVLYLLLDVVPEPGVVLEHQDRDVGTEALAFAKRLGRSRELRLLVRPRSLSSLKGTLSRSI
jgi:hypothetical protein